MNSKSIAESIFEAAVAARAMAAELGKAAAASAGKQAVDRIMDKVMGKNEAPVNDEVQEAAEQELMQEPAMQDAPVPNQGGSQAVPDTQTQNPVGTEQSAPVAPQEEPAIPMDMDVGQGEPTLPSEISLDDTLDADAVSQAMEDPQVVDPRSTLINSLAGVNEVRYMSGLRKRILRRG